MEWESPPTQSQYQRDVFSERNGTDGLFGGFPKSMCETRKKLQSNAVIPKDKEEFLLPCKVSTNEKNPL